MENKASSQKWALTLFAIGVFMAALDNGIISAALTTINKSFDVSANWGAWGVTIYTLGLAISVPIVGKLSDKYGRKKLFLIEIALFGLGSLLVALSPNFTFYLIARFIQAMGGGGIFIIGSAHVLSTMPVEKQGKALGLLGGMNGIASVIGPNLGSFLIDLTGNWHVLFFINLPIAVVLLIFGYTKLQETSNPDTGKLDMTGTILLSLAILGIMYGLTNIEGVNFFDSLLEVNVYGFLLGGLLLFIALLIYESRLEKKGGDPILPFRLLKRAPYLLTLLIGMFSGALLAGMIFIPAFSEQVLGIAAEKSGYWMTPLALAAGFGAGMGGALTDKKGPVFAVLLSGIVSAVGFFLFPGFVEAKWQFIIASIIAGAGMGVILGAPLNMLATEGIEKDKGSAIATLSLLRQVGMTLAPTIYAGFIARGFNELPDLYATDFPNKLQDNLQNAHLSAEAQAELGQLASQFSSGGEFSQQQMTAAIDNIQDPTLKEALTSTVQEMTTIAAQNGYGGLFMTAGILAVLIIIVALFLPAARKKYHLGKKTA